jgi:uridine phosphorylase
MRNAYEILVGKYKGKRQLQTQRGGGENSMKMHLEEIRCKGVEWLRTGSSGGLL